jgi:hypothetical protein
MVRSASLGARVTPEVLEAAKRCARAEHRSVASLAEMLLVRHLQEHGYLPKEWPEPAPEPAPPAAGRARRKAAL